MKKLLLHALVRFIGRLVHAQDLRCNISVNASQIQGTYRQVFQTMQTDLYEFMNNRSWSNNVYSVDERIECNFLLNITEQVGPNEYKGTLQVQARRPVFGSSYTTVLFNFNDNDVQFSYQEFNKLEFNENSYGSALTSLLAYYAYIVIGLDYDSFSPKGGTEFFKKAEKIVSNAQTAPEKGWKSYESSRKNRYWLVENLLNPKYSQVRNAIYTYHRLGLDQMGTKVSEGRDEVTNSLLSIQKVFRDKPDPHLFLLKIFFDAKSDEIVNVYSEAYASEKQRVYQMLSEIDQANEPKYKKITEEKKTN